MLSLAVALLTAVLFFDLVTTSQHTDFVMSKNDISVKDSALAPVRLLYVPYVEQGATNWCFEAALSMVLQYYGEIVGPSHIAKDLGAGPDDSVSFLDMFFGPVDSYLSKRPELSFRHDVRIWDFPQYANLVDSGQPLIVSTFGFKGHTVVVVGYSEHGERYVYVHDPSGYYSKLAWDTNKTEFARVPWLVFSKSYWTKLIITPVN